MILLAIQILITIIELEIIAILALYVFILYRVCINGREEKKEKKEKTEEELASLKKKDMKEQDQKQGVNQTLNGLEIIDLDQQEAVSSTPLNVTQPKTVLDLSVRLGLSNREQARNINYRPVLKEEEQGELRVCKCEGNKYYVLPYNDMLQESSYQHSAIKICFRCNYEIKPGEKYHVDESTQCAVLKKEGAEYTLEEEGELIVTNYNRENDSFQK